MASKTTRQTSFADPETKVRDIFARARDYDFEKVILAVSGGTDSVLAAILTAIYGPEYGIEPDVVLHANTGASVPQTRLVAKITAALCGVPFVERNNGTLAKRTLKHGWPADTKPGHFFERIERKSDVFDSYHAEIDEQQLWISGARATESKERSMNVPDSGVEPDDRRSRMTWVSPLAGITTGEKWEFIFDLGLPVSETYFWLGISGECVACAHDDAGLLDDLDRIAPELSMAIRTLTVWLAMLARRGDAEITPKQLCWGWDPETDDTSSYTDQTTLDGREGENEAAWIGCDSASCSDRDIPDQVFDLPAWQIVDRPDVLTWWDGGEDEIIDRFCENVSLPTGGSYA